jgi:hypothetical protein
MQHFRCLLINLLSLNGHISFCKRLPNIGKSRIFTPQSSKFVDQTAHNRVFFLASSPFCFVYFAFKTRTLFLDFAVFFFRNQEINVIDGAIFSIVSQQTFNGEERERKCGGSTSLRQNKIALESVKIKEHNREISQKKQCA